MALSRAALDLRAGTTPTPEFAAMVAEECRLRLDGLRDETLRRVALLKMEGCTNVEVAGRLGCGLRTVVRKLELIRRAWLAEAGFAGVTLELSGAIGYFRGVRAE